MGKITFQNKSSCFIQNVTFLGEATIGPNTTLKNCVIGDKVNISCSEISKSKVDDNTSVSHSMIQSSKIGKNCQIGPFSHIRPDSVIGDDCRIGNFVEIKKSNIGSGSKVSHLSYVGDATLGKNVNVGCGVIFANYDGANKHQTFVGDNVFIGSNCNLVAPLTIGDNVFVAAGSTVTKSLNDNAFCIARERETIREGKTNLYAQKFLPKPKTYFGTDGIRLEGTKQEFFEIGKKFGKAITTNKLQKIVLGRDTRASGKNIRDGILQGIDNAQIFDLGICSTPCVAFMTKALGADFGIVLTASHNPESFNGIKVFDKLGQKLSPDKEQILEHKLQDIDEICKNSQNFEKKRAKNIKISKISPKKYISFVSNLSKPMPNFEVAIDVSGGASEKLARTVFEKLGVRAHIIGSSKNHKINDGCGCLNLDHLKSYMKDFGVPIGFAFDGDGDRVLAVDEKLQVVDGDQFLFMLAKDLKAQNKLKNNCVVATVMSNLALTQKLNECGIATSITPVGDKFVIEEINHLDASLGGEQSGHIITKDVCGSGDGLLVSVLICSLVHKSSTPLHTLSRLDRFPQLQESFKTPHAQTILNSPELKAKIQEFENFLGDEGRILIRKSGTEQKLRLLVESKSKRNAKKVFEALKSLIEKMC